LISRRAEPDQSTEKLEMTSRDITADVLDFLASYRKAFENYDSDAIVAHYCFPCQLVSDAEPVAVATIEEPEKLKAAVDYILSLHREIGVRSSRITQLDIAELSPRLTGMMLRYDLVDIDGKPLYDMQCFYSLARTDRGYRIAGLTHNQLPRLLACAGRASIPIS
jgi:hypothetical protein